MLFDVANASKYIGKRSFLCEYPVRQRHILLWDILLREWHGTTPEESALKIMSVYRVKGSYIRLPWYRSSAYRIRPNFRGPQFSRIALSKHFAETIFTDQEFRVYGILKFTSLIFADY